MIYPVGLSAEMRHPPTSIGRRSQALGVPAMPPVARRPLSFPALSLWAPRRPRAKGLTPQWAPRPSRSPHLLGTVSTSLVLPLSLSRVSFLSLLSPNPNHSPPCNPEASSPSSSRPACQSPSWLKMVLEKPSTLPITSVNLPDQALARMPGANSCPTLIVASSPL